MNVEKDETKGVVVARCITAGATKSSELASEVNEKLVLPRTERCSCQSNPEKTKAT